VNHRGADSHAVAAAIEPPLDAPRQSARTLRANGWSVGHLLLIAALIAAGVWLTWDGWRDLVWLAIYDEESSQIMLVPIIAAWLLWIRRHRLAQIAPAFSLLGPAFIALGWAAWEYSYYNNVRVAGHIAAVALLVGAILSVTGGKVFWKFLPVFGVLIFAIPVPHSIRLPLSVPLQRLTAQITEHLMQLFSVNVTRAGSVLTINDINVGVAEACNGMRMVFAVFLVTYLVVFSSRINWALRILVLAMAPLLALVCNIIRLVPTVYLYGYSSKDVAEQFHDLSGWVMNVVAFALLLGVLSLVRWILDQPPRTSEALTQPAGGK
jgi:exosortase